MLKMYRFQGDHKEYWETWEEEPSQYCVHWGELGKTGETENIESTLLRKAETVIQEQVDKLVSTGFVTIAPEEHSVLLIEYSVDGMGSGKDLDKRHRLEGRMNETLGWTGLGACDGGSIGSGSMEVCCFVVDFDVAKQVIEADLADTQFADYTRIYKEDAE